MLIVVPLVSRNTSRRITWVTGKPGAGKTILLAQWSTQLCTPVECRTEPRVAGDPAQSQDR
jgi:predicted ATPase